MGLFDSILKSSTNKNKNKKETLAPLPKLLKANKLNYVKGKKEFCIRNDIKSIVSTKNGNRTAEEYLLIKQIVFVKKQWGIKSNSICPNCHTEIKENHTLFCEECNYNFIDEYDFDYDELIKTKVVGIKEYTSYTDEKLGEYIKNNKPEIFNKNLSEFADNLTINKYAYLLNAIAYHIVENGKDIKTRDEYSYNNKTMSYDKVIKIIEKNGTDYKTSKHVMIFAECCIVDNENDGFLPNAVISKDGKKKYLKKDYINAVKDVVEYRTQSNKNPAVISIAYEEVTSTTNDKKKTNKSSSTKRKKKTKKSPTTKSRKKPKKTSSTKPISADKLNNNKSLSDDEKFELLLPQAAKTLGVDKNECYSAQLRIHRLENNFSGNLSTSRSNHAVIFTIYEDKITYVIVGNFPLSKGAKLKVFDDRDEIFNIYFNDIMYIKKGKHNLGYDLQMKDGLALYLSSYGKSKFAKELSDKFDKFQTNSNVKTQVTVEEKDPLTKIKEAKELLDIGALTQEEFDEIKSKYLKQV